MVIQHFNSSNKQRKTQTQKDAKDGQWYKDQANLLDSHSFSENHFIGFSGITEYRRKKVSYDLFNNIINLRDLEYVCQPYGADVGSLPANMTNRDIVSGKIKVLLGMEMKMPFSWKAFAVNEEATTRKEQEEARRIREFVSESVLAPIRLEVQSQTQAQQKGKKLTPEEQQQLAQQIQEEVQSKTPDEVRRYMTREHQDPAEVQAQQILEYLIQKEKVNDKFNKGFKHTNLAGEEIYWVGILNREPCLKVINPLFFDYDKSPDLDYIEDGEWAVHEYRMSPSEVISNFGDQLEEEEIDRIYEFQNNRSHLSNTDFTFSTDRAHESYTVRVLHTTWKSLKKIGFLEYFSNKTGKEELMIVDENYKLDALNGDIDIEWEWIPEAHECYKILDDIYVHYRPVPGQHKDLDNLWNCKLPYYGASCDSLNSPTTSPMERMKAYQYLFDIILYRIELLMASDKGKILIANIKALPKSAGIDTNKFMYFLEANKIGWFNPNEEGNKGTGDVTNLVKEIDMSLASDIQKYIQVAEYIERKCGSSIGVTPQMEAQIEAREAVGNTRQNLVQSSHIIQPYFELHNIVKGNVLTALLENAKVAYSSPYYRGRKLTYVLDDMSIKMLAIDQELLDASTCGIFIANSSKAADAKQAVETLGQAALQNQQADLGDLIKVIRSNSVNEAEELLEAAHQRKMQEEQAASREKLKADERARIQQQADLEKQWAHDEAMIVLKEKERRKTEIQKQTILSLGFNEDKDLDDDEVPDVIEVAKFGVDADIKGRKLALDERKQDHLEKTDKEELEIKREKLKNDKIKKKAQKTT